MYRAGHSARSAPVLLVLVLVLENTKRSRAKDEDDYESGRDALRAFAISDYTRVWLTTPAVGAGFLNLDILNPET